MVVNMKSINIFVIVLWILNAGVPCFGTGVRVTTCHGAEAVRNRQVRYSVTMQNMKGDLLPLAELYMYVPLEKTSFQQDAGFTVTHPYRTVNDKEGNQVICVTLTNMPPYATSIVTIEANVLLQENPAPLALGDRRYLGASRLIECDNPAFDKLAPAVSKDMNLDTVKKLFDWVRQHVKITGYVRQDKGALYALQKQRGDCTDAACLFVALCRRQGIPARVMGGVVCDRNVIIRPGDYHNWAEFYLDGKWQLADPQKNRFMKDEWQYVAFTVLGDGKGPVGTFPRFRYVGTGLKVRMN